MKMAAKTVLLVDDDQAILEMMRDVLEIEGYRVAVAKNGQDAITQLRTLDDKPSLIVLDLMMPILNGWEFLDFQRSQTQFSKIPIVICSAYFESAKSIKPSAVVPKPVQLEPLLSAVKLFCA
jgi:two-component system, chemotaxis family, chemotaxis protein CheY